MKCIVDEKKKSIIAHYVLECVRVHHRRECQQLLAFAVVKTTYGNVFNSKERVCMWGK